MILVVDIGNTNTKFGIFDASELVCSLRLSNSISKTSDEYGFYLMNVMKANGIECNEISGAIISSVNPNFNYTFEHMIRYFFKVSPLVVGSGVRTGINVRYDNPKEVGADRIMGCVAAYHLYGGPCIIIDCGTATTFNVVNEHGDFVGGAIAFGLKSSADALAKAAAKLPKIELNVPDKVIGRSTIACMQSGVLYGYIGMVESMVNRIKKELGVQCKVIATGGLSEIVAERSGVIDIIDRLLTLKGLNIVYGLNRTE